MNKSTILSLGELNQLENELQGISNAQTGEKVTLGLLNEKLSLVTKYWLSDLYTKISVETKNIEKLRMGLIEKLGVVSPNGSISISATIEVKEEVLINPAFVEFQKEIEILFNETKEISHHDFKLSEFSDLTTSNNYLVVYKLISTEA